MRITVGFVFAAVAPVENGAALTVGVEVGDGSIESITAREMLGNGMRQLTWRA
jgi:hypothetical protein